jgi:hypothetical protein
MNEFISCLLVIALIVIFQLVPILALANFNPLGVNVMSNNNFTRTQAIAESDSIPKCVKCKAPLVDNSFVRKAYVCSNKAMTAKSKLLMIATKIESNEVDLKWVQENISKIALNLEFVDS